jgi:hypothetical protein
MPDMPIMAQRLSDGSTLGAGFFGLVKLDDDWKSTWSFTREDAAPHFPLLNSWGVVEMADHRLIVVNDDWHVKKEGDNRVPIFAVDSEKNISWMLSATAFKEWKRSEVEPKTGLTEHRCVIVQPLDSAVRSQ